MLNIRGSFVVQPFTTYIQFLVIFLYYTDNPNNVKLPLATMSSLLTRGQRGNPPGGRSHGVGPEGARGGACSSVLGGFGVLGGGGGGRNAEIRILCRHGGSKERK